MTRTAYTYYEKKLEREQEAEMIRDAELQIRMLEVAVEAYRIDTGAFPLTLDELVSDPGRIDKSSIVPKWRGPYCVRIPKDPWGQEYGYDRIERGNFIVINFDIYSKGKDGISGTADDINSWKMRKERDKERLEREIYFHPLGSE
jgi:general secretion pathway protein G